MAMLKYLLDTNIVIHVIKQRWPEVLEIFNRHHGRMAISSITLAELIQCTKKSTDISIGMIEDFSSRLALLHYDDKAAWQYCQIRDDLESAGQTISVNNLYIAAQARSNGLTLVTDNMREFGWIPGLLLENWVGAKLE